jgi:hypothetical protein
MIHQQPTCIISFNCVSFFTRFQPTFPPILTLLPECLDCLGQAVSPGRRHYLSGLMCVCVCLCVCVCVCENPVESANILPNKWTVVL